MSAGYQIGDVRIRYENEDFPKKYNWPASETLRVNWDDLVWAGITIGRPNSHYVFQHGDSSLYEALFRWSLIRMAVEQNGPSGSTLRRTDAFKALDPTEKGAVNYFLRMAICKLFATKLLDTPWLLHLDVFKNSLDSKIFTGRSRPDLIGLQMNSQKWHAFECKGRTSPPDPKEKKKAKTTGSTLDKCQR